MEEILKSIQESLKAAGIKVGDGKEEISRKDLPSFKEVWERYIMPLQNQDVPLLRGRFNRITKVTRDGLTRISINDKESEVPIDVFKYTYNKLLSNPSGTISRVDEILARAMLNGSLSSTIVVAVFAHAVPFITRTDGSKGLQLLLK